MKKLLISLLVVTSISVELYGQANPTAQVHDGNAILTGQLGAPGSATNISFGPVNQTPSVKISGPKAEEPRPGMQEVITHLELADTKPSDWEVKEHLPENISVESLASQYQLINNELMRIDAELDSISFWTSFAWFDFIKTRLTGYKITNLMLDLKTVEKYIQRLPDQIDGQYNTVKAEIYGLFRKIKETYNTEVLLYKNARVTQVKDSTRDVIRFIEKHLQAYEEVLSSISDLRTQLANIVFWCRVRRLNLPWFTSWCIQTDGSAMLDLHRSKILGEIERLPTQNGQANVVQTQLRNKFYEVMEEITKELREY